VSTWLDPLRRALDEHTDPAHFFFRDDDAGWNDERLFTLLDVFAPYGIPLDLAVIPTALTPSLAESLCRRIEGSHGLVGVHQHGYAHVNHQPEGRKCEFGSARDCPEQRNDVALGQSRLQQLLGNHLDPIFTPPWNRCTDSTGRALAELGFRILSREHRAPPLEIAGLAELPVHMDWFAHHKQVRLNREEWCAALTSLLSMNSEPIGIMFHHAVMNDDEMEAVDELLGVLARSARVKCHNMRNLAGKDGSAVA
jgi:peptidoglycan/xylan/chitin deacetylase (PgdA/CDA1 family)